MASFNENQSSLLLSVIRKLLDCYDDDDDRLHQRRKLEEDLMVAEDRMDSHVSLRQSELHGALVTFSQVDARITNAQKKVQNLKKSLLDCRTLLQCKRDDLKRLWAEDMKYKTILNELHLIEKVKGVPEELKILKANKHYLHATELLTITVTQLDKDLAMIDALRELRTELRSHKEKLHAEIIEELHRHLYIKFTPKEESLKKVQEQSVVLSASSSPATARRTNLPARAMGHSRTLSRTQALVAAAAAVVEQQSSVDISTATKEAMDSEEVIEDLSVPNPEADSAHYMAILVESLNLLGKIPEAVKEIHNRMETELLLMLERAAVQVSVNAGMSIQEIASKARPDLLVDLLQTCFDRFCNVVAAHEVLLQRLQTTKQTYKLDFQMYSKKEVWDVVQSVLQQVLSEHLAIDEASTLSASPSTNALSNMGDIGSYFLPKKRPAAIQQTPLFKFDSSHHAISISIYLKERRHAELASTGANVDTNFSRMESSGPQTLVCIPRMRNVIKVFRIICDFVSKLEANLNLKQGEHCDLYHFIHSFVEETFIDAIRIEHTERIHNSCKPEVVRSTADPKSIKGLQISKPVFQSVVVMWKALEDLHQLMNALPKYANRFLTIACNLASQFRDECHILYRLLTVHGGESGRRVSSITANSMPVMSARWARDEDISRMLRSLPSWKNMHDAANRAPFTILSEPGAYSLHQSQHQKESELLTSNLGTEHLRSSDIILNLDTLKTIATLHESLEWLTMRMKELTMNLTTHGVGGTAEQIAPPPSNVAGTKSPLPESTALPTDQGTITLELIDQLSKISFGFQSLVDASLLVLHLEVRCHCFYYMTPAVSKSSYVSEGNQDVEPEITELIKDFFRLEVSMQEVLQPPKFRYLFDGLGHLISTIFISSTGHLRKINPDGIKKMLKNITELQHSLSKITLNRESNLDHAKQYYELLYLNSDEMLHLIAEQGRFFSQHEYANALKLIAQSQRNFDYDGLQKRLETLAQHFSVDNV